MFQQPIKYPTVLGGPGAVASIAEDYAPASRRGSWAADETRINRTYSTRLKVTTTRFDLGPLGVINALGVRIGDSYRFPIYSSVATETDTGSFVQSIEVEQDAEGGCQWAVTIEYGPFDVPALLGTNYVSQGIIDPTARAWEVYWDSAKYKRSRPYDQSDPPLAYVNSIHDPLLDPPETEETRPVLKLVHVEPSYNEGLANAYRDTTNADTFLGCDPNTVKCRDIRGELHWDADWGIVWQITYEFEFRVDDPENNGFYQMLLNQGYRYKKNGSGNPINAVDDNGQNVTDAILLKKNGDKLPTTDDPYFLQFTEFPQVSFEGLNIPQDILQKSSW